jgi:hypothetical protein
VRTIKRSAIARGCSREIIFIDGFDAVRGRDPCGNSSSFLAYLLPVPGGGRRAHVAKSTSAKLKREEQWKEAISLDPVYGTFTDIIDNPKYQQLGGLLGASDVV